MGNRLSLLLIVLCLVLGATIYFETREHNRQAPRSPGIASDNAGRRSEPSAGSAASQPLVPELTALTETLDRPLFTADRKPVVVTDNTTAPTIEAPAATTSQRPSLVLSAVIINGDRRMALLQELGSDTATIHAEQGQSLVGGWLLKEVTPERVVLSRDGQQQELLLRKFQPPPPALLPATAPRTAAVAKQVKALAEALDLRRPRRPLRGPRLRSTQRNTRE